MTLQGGTWRSILLIGSAAWALLYVAVMGYFGLRPYFIDDCAGLQGLCEPAERLWPAGIASLVLLFAGALRALFFRRGGLLIAGWAVVLFLSTNDGLLLFIPAVRRWQGIGPVDDVGHALSLIFLRPLVLSFVAGLLTAVIAELPFGARKRTTAMHS